MRFVVDTNIFNHIIDGNIDTSLLPLEERLIATHIQLDEINNTANRDRRAQLFLMFAKFSPEILPTESSVWGKGRWGEGKWSNGNLLKRIISALDNKKRRHNNTEDALIAEIALVNNFGLITADGTLSDVAQEFGIYVVFFDINSAKIQQK